LADFTENQLSENVGVNVGVSVGVNVGVNVGANVGVNARIRLTEKYGELFDNVELNADGEYWEV